MASGSVPRGSISLGSDQIFYRNCSVCEQKHKIKESVNYCTECKKYFCQECLDFHNSLQVDHRTKLRILGKSTMLKSPAKSGSRDTITTMCEEHSDKLVELYCRTHDVVCCTVCLALKHTLCENAEYIPNVAGGFSHTKEVLKLKSDLQNIKKELATKKSNRHKDKTRIQQESNRVLTQITDYRRRIDLIFDKLEESVFDGTQQRLREYGGQIQTDLDDCEDAIKRIETAIKEFDDVGKHNDSQLFVDVKKGVENLGEFRELVEQIQNHVGRDKIEFTVDKGIEAYIGSLERLGKFVDEMSGAGLKPQTVVGREDAMVKMKDDSITCYISGSCCLPDGGALLSDYSNNKLKRLDSSYRVTDSCGIQRPYGVCYIPHTKEAAVCQSAGSVYIVSLGGTITRRRSIKTDSGCYGVSYCNGLLYVGQHGFKVQVYDFVSGDLKSTIHTDERGQQIFSDAIRHIASHPDGTRIWVADCKNGLVQLDNSGNLCPFTDDELASAAGVCLGRDNSVLVSVYSSWTVLQVRPDGEVNTLVRTDELPAAPLSICYDKDRARLLVTMYNCDHVTVFHIK